MTAFEQYRHVGALRRLSAEPSTELTKAWGRIKAHVRDLDQREPSSSPWDRLIGDMEQALATERDQRSLLLEEAGDESILGLDVAISRSLGQGPPHLEAGLSLKWSLRTDRAQDCRSQGAKLAALRRGRMPHFAAVTMEPRPYMLNLLCGGSGEIDCVYHLDLPALNLAIESTCSGNQARRKAADTFRRLVGQRRLRDYDELVAFVEGLA